MAKIRLLLLLLVIGVMSAAVIPTSAQDASTVITLSVPEFFFDVYQNQIIPQFEAENPGIRVHLEKSGGFGMPVVFGDDVDAYLDDVADYVSSADVVVVDSDMPPEVTRAGYFLDLLPLAISDPSMNIDDFYRAAWETFQWDGGLWGLPVAADIILLFYDPAAFDKANLAYPNENWTVDDLIYAIQQLTEFDAEGKASKIAFQSIGGVSTTGALMSVFAGDDLIDESVSPIVPDFSNPNLETVLTAWNQLTTDGYFNQSGQVGVVITIGGGQDVVPITVGRSNFGTAQYGGPNAQPYGVTKMPGGVSSMYVNGFGVSSGTRYPEAAYQLAKFLTYSPDAVSAFFGGTPARRGVERTQGGPGAGPVFFGGNVPAEVQAVIDAAYENARPVSREHFARYIQDVLNKMQQDELDARTALNEVQDTILSNLQTASDRRATTQITVKLPPEQVQLVPGEISMTFGATDNISPYPNESQWIQAARDFAAQDPEVGEVKVETGFPESLETMTTKYDCFVAPNNLVSNGDLSLLRSIDPLLDSDPTFDRSDLVGNTLAQLQREGLTWAYPFMLQPRAMSYNADIFAQAGVPEPLNGWTTDDFENALRALKNHTGDEAPFNPQFPGNEHIMALIAAYGGLPYDYRVDPAAINFTDPVTVEAIREVLELVKEGLVDYQTLTGEGGPVAFSIGGDGTPLTMTTVGGLSFGRAVRVFNSRSGDDEEDAPSPNRVVTFPVGTQYNAASYEVTAAYISANTTYAEACYRFISYVARQYDLFEGMPARRSVINSPELAASQSPDKIAFYKQMDTLLSQPNTIIFPAQTGGRVASFIEGYWLDRAFDRYVDADANLEEELAQAQAFTLEFLECTAALPSFEAPAPGQGGGGGAFQEYFQQVQNCMTSVDPTATGVFGN